MKIIFFGLMVLMCTYAGASTKPKYGPQATLLSQSHDYIQKNKAPDYWALSPYYLPQQNGKSCSVASVAMIVNAARSGQPLTSEDALATHDGMLKKVNDTDWNKAVDMTSLGGGVALDNLKTKVEEALKAYGVKNFSVQVFHMENTPEAKAKLHELLVQNEKSSRDFILANFIQSAYTGDADEGHISPVGAYDGKTKRVLIMDVDREWYEPYWVSEETFAQGMATKDKEAGQTRGYLYIKLN
jgi:hypothetical protein